MTLPAQVQAQVAQSNQILEQIHGTAAAEPVEGAPEPVAALEPAPAVAVAPAPQPSQGVPAQPAQNADVALLQQQYRSLQGMFASTQQQLREAQGTIQGLREALTHTAPSVPTSVPAPAGAPQPSTRVVSAKEMEEYGPEFFAMMQRFMHAEMQPVVGAVQSLRGVAPAVQALQGQVGHLTTATVATSESNFMQAVEARVPDVWRINDDQRFHAWLNQLDPMTKLTRQAYLDDARRALDVERVVNIFSAFLSTFAPAPAGGAAPSVPTSQQQLAAQAAPGTRRSPATPTGSAPVMVYTKADLLKLYEDQRRGLYKGKEAEFAAAEKVLMNAINTGNYRN